MVLTVGAFSIILLVVLVGSAMQRVSGMGLGLIGAPVLSLLVGPVSGVLIINVLAAVNAIMQSISVREYIDWKRFWLIGPVMLLGAIPGAWVVHNTPTAPLQILVGTLVLIGLTITTYMPEHMRKDGAGYAVAAGVSGGFMNTLAGIAGPAITVYAQASRWPQRAFAATLQPLFFVSGTLSVLVKELSAEQSIFGTAPWYLWPVAVLAMLIGIRVGTRVAAHVSRVHARKLALAIAALGAMVVLIRGAVELVG